MQVLTPTVIGIQLILGMNFARYIPAILLLMANARTTIAEIQVPTTTPAEINALVKTNKNKISTKAPNSRSAIRTIPNEGLL